MHPSSSRFLPQSVCSEASGLDWDKLLPSTTGIFWRHRWKEYAQLYGLPFSRGHMQNLASRGDGPPHVLQFGKVAYTRDALVGWLNSHQTAQENRRLSLSVRKKEQSS